MKVKNIVRKAVALGSGATLVATSIVGAFAYDLSTYPSKYIVDGQFDGKIVVGERAATADVLGSIDIAASLQGASVSKVAVPGAAGEVSLSGDVFEFDSSSDALELREPLDLVAETITDEDLAGLKSGRITTSEGATNFEQYLRLEDGANVQRMTVNYVQNTKASNRAMGDYLLANKQTAWLEWEVQFDEGLESEWTQVGTTARGTLEDLEDKTINIMGTDYTIVEAFVESDNDNFEMTLMGGSVPDTLREGETKTYTINGVDYEVTLVFVSDPNSGTVEAKFSVNGELTDAMGEGDTETLSGGLQMGVRDILVNAREGVASFYLGAHKLTITDPFTDNTLFDGDIEVNEDVDESDVVEVAGTYNNAVFEVTSIKYLMKMEPAAGGATVFIPAGHGVRELVDEPELLLSETLDLRYEGLTEPVTSIVEVAPSAGDDEYTISFTNIDGDEYVDVPLVSTDGALNMHFGDATDDLVFVESAATFNVGIDDYVIVTSKSAAADRHKAVTNVLQYDSYDADQRTLTFTNLAGGKVSTVLTDAGATATGSINVGGHTYPVVLDLSGVDDDDAALRIDHDGDGSITNDELARITTWGGLVINPAAAVVDDNSSVASLLTVVGNGLDFADGAGITGTETLAVNMTATVDDSLFDTSGTPETFTWVIEETTTTKDELDIDFDDTSYVGPLEGGNSLVSPFNDFQFNEVTRNADENVGMTDYGILVTETDPDDTNDAKTLTLEVPEEQRTAQVFLTMGAVTASEGSAGSADRVNPIAVGLAVLDTNAPALGSENLIIVGGPCANTVAAAFLGNPANCAEGFEAGKAMIASKEQSGHVAILVAGYEATETLGASRVLASYKDYADKLKGTEVEVVVADLNDIDVTPAQ